VRPAPPKRRAFFLKRADRYLTEQLDAPFTIADLARHCGVSLRTLEKAMVDNRGVTPVAHVRNARLDQARRALEAGDDAVADVAHRLGFRSATTFALAFRKRFGVAPSRARRASLRPR
jgi:transcriptional regulator GlxA family with amidase domain